MLGIERECRMKTVMDCLHVLHEARNRLAHNIVHSFISPVPHMLWILLTYSTELGDSTKQTSKIMF